MAHIKVYLKPIYDGSNTQEELNLRALADEFTNQTGINIDLEFSPAVSLSDYRADLTTKLKNPQHDIYAIEQSWSGSFPRSFLDISTLNTPDLAPFLGEQQSETVALSNVEGQGLVSVPMWADYGALFYRADILAANGIRRPPQTWDELEENCLRILNRTSGSNNGGSSSSPHCFATPFADDTIVLSATEWLASSTTKPLIGAGLTFNFDDPNVANILTKIRSWVTRGILGPEVLNWDEKAALSQWLRGNLVFLQGKSSYFYKTLQDATFNTAEGSPRAWNITRLPARLPSMSQSTVSGFHLTISSKSSNPQPAARVLRFLTSSQVQNMRARLHGLPSSFKATYTASNPTCESAIPCAVIRDSQFFVRPAAKVVPKWLEVADVLIETLKEFFKRPEIPAAAGLEVAKGKVEQILGVKVSNATADGTRNATTSQTDNTGGNNNRTPILIAAVLGGLVVVGGCLGGFLMIQKRKNGWPYNRRTTYNETPKPKESIQPVYEWQPASAGGTMLSGTRAMSVSSSRAYTADPSTPVGVPSLPPLSPVERGYYPPERGSLVHQDVSVANGWGASVSPTSPKVKQIEPLTRAMMGGSDGIRSAPDFSNPSSPRLSLDRPYQPERNPYTTALESRTPSEISYNAPPSQPKYSPHLPTLQSIPSPKSPQLVTSNSASSPFPLSESMGRFHTVMHPYVPLQEDEIALSPGDVILLKTAYDDGYAYGELEDGRGGVFPLACLVGGGLEGYMNGSISGGGLGSVGSVGSGSSSISPVPAMSGESPEILLMNGRITEEVFLRLQQEKKEKEERQIVALKERLARPDLNANDRERLQRRLDELELGI
ncbi:hypothetical protein HDV05_007019 [Chytridiales sp. JEL 0842]|nr:hypothetical protein HDV05_007019 [Chytridiales sp. JEL 0842]